MILLYIDQLLVNNTQLSLCVETLSMSISTCNLSFKKLSRRWFCDIIQWTIDKIDNFENFYLQYEAYHWIYAALILIAELTNETRDYKPLDVKFDMTQFSKARTGKSDICNFIASKKKRLTFIGWANFFLLFIQLWHVINIDMCTFDQPAYFDRK